MTDDKKGREDKKAPDEDAEIDWDAALSDWESKTFVPEVARDVQTDQPASLSGRTGQAVPPRPAGGGAPPAAPVPSATMSRPLYRPPPAPPSRPRAAPSPPVAPGARPARPAPLAVDEDEGGATVITRIPQELLRKHEEAMAAKPSPPTTSRGGLGQFFARDDKRDEVVTSAQPVPSPTSRGDRSGVGPLRRPLRSEDAPNVSDGEMFDPFAEPRAQQLTVPAEEELGPLLSTASPSPSSANIEDPRAADKRPTFAPPSGGPGGPASSRRTAPPPLPPPPATPELSILPDLAESGPHLAESGEVERFDESLLGEPHDEASLRETGDTGRAGPVASAGQDETSGLKPREGTPPDAARSWSNPPGAPDRHWDDEKPASAWLDAAARDSLLTRAAWLEQEARTLEDDVERGRGLLACSEILATAGELDRAGALAVEARGLAPSLALAHRQVRALVDLDPDDSLEALDAEAALTPAGPARVHTALLAVDVARAAGDDDEADRRLEALAKVAPADVRTAIARAARALALDDGASAQALRLPDARDMTPIIEALRVCANLRGASGSSGRASEGTKTSPNEVLLRARQALDTGDVATAAPLVAALASIPELARGATWLAAALGAVRPERRRDAMGWLRDLAAGGDAEAHRPLVARALELGDGDHVAQAVAAPSPLRPAERVVLAALAGAGRTVADEHVEASLADAGTRLLACAAAAIGATRDAAGTERTQRARLTGGSARSRAGVELGRLLAAASEPATLRAALDSFGALSADAGGTDASGATAIALELATRERRAGDVSSTIQSWASGRATPDERTAGALAAAIVAERGGDTARALQAYKAAQAADGRSEAALRAIASLGHVDIVAEMNALADELGDGLRGALARLEAVTFGETDLPDPTRADLLERAHEAAPALPIAGFLAERIARRAGDVDEVLRWVRDRRVAAADPTDAALDAVREALLVADRDPLLAGERLREAHQARPADLALRELYERMAPDPPDDRASWREGRAASMTGDGRTLVLLEAVREYERAGDEEGALRSAEAAAATDAPLGRVARERAELRAGRVGRLSEELFMQVKGTEDPRLRRESFERLAHLDAAAGQDPASALLWHRSILEETPAYKPSLRHLEHRFIGEGRDDELEPVVSAIAVALRGTESPECSAHAELAARLRLRGAAASWEATRDMVELAAAEVEPSLWSLRMLQSHARSRGDEATFLDVTKRLIERTSRSGETATLLVRAGEAAVRLDRMPEARALFERATVEDAGDVVAWEELAHARHAAGDARGAAEASESLARTSLVHERRLAAWYDAACIWQDEANDEDRALAALEEAAALDVTHGEIFERLSRVYASRKMQAELAGLLERRMESVTDPEERLAIEIRRGRVLFGAGDVAGARAAYDAALAERPDDAGALAALVDLCLAQEDWETAEQSLIRLARILPNPDAQREIYTRLGELYATHVVNLPRAEVALKEVLKSAPDDMETIEKLVDVYKRQNDAARAVELQQDLVLRSRSPEEKRSRLVELALIHEHVAHDHRRAEQTLEGARREFPQDIALLRALAEFYTRHKQTPAFNILLDRAAADARRALTAGRLTPASFEILGTTFDLRGKADAARVSHAMLATLEGRSVELAGAGVERAFDPRLDDLLAPDVLTPSMRGLLAKTGDALDAVIPVDLRSMRAVPIAPDAALARFVAKTASAMSLGPVTVLVAPKLGTSCIPIGSTPPTVVVGEGLMGSSDERIGNFLALRALKLIRAKASALGRIVPGELGVLVSAWLKCMSPGWEPQGINAGALASAVTKLQAILPRNIVPEVAAAALEVAASIGTRQATLGPAALAWANRVAFLALGDPNAALDAIAAAGSPGAVGTAGPSRGAPREGKDRAAWIARTPEARDLVAFAVSDAFADARSRLGG